MTTLFDASSLWEAAQFDSAETLVDGAVTSLTAFELGNTLRKHMHKGVYTPGEAEKVRETLNAMLGIMQVIHLEEVEEEILKIAVQEELTYYDASYLYAALERGAELVTEDEELVKAARRRGVPCRSTWDLRKDA